MKSVITRSFQVGSFIFFLICLASIYLPAQLIDPGFNYPPVPFPEVKSFEKFVEHSNIIKYDVASGKKTTIKLPDIKLSDKEFEYRPGNIEAMEGMGNSEDGIPKIFTDLVRIGNPEEFPWRTNVKIFFVGPDGKIYVGSGALIDPKHVLTAGHLVYEPLTDFWTTDMHVRPGWEFDGEDQTPYGTAQAVSFYVFDQWEFSGGITQDWDIAIVELDRPIGAITGWQGFGYNSSNAFFLNNTFHNAGYPAEDPYYDGLLQYYWYGDFDSYDPIFTGPHRIYHNKRGYSGMSGSSFYSLLEPNVRIAYGVYVHSSPSLGAGYCRITDFKFNKFVSIMDGHIPNEPDFIPLNVKTTSESVKAGDQVIDLEYLLHNYSLGSFAGNISWEVYLSSDRTISPVDDILLNTYFFDIDIGSKNSFNLFHNPNPTVPPNTPPGTYYLGVKVNNSDFNAGNNTTSVQDVAEIQVEEPSVISPSWQYVVTDNNHTVVLPSNLIGDLGSIPLELNDYIGFFFENNGTKECAGFGQWLGTNSSISVFGDDASTLQKEGFDEGEIFNIIVWKSCCGTEIHAQGTFLPPDNFLITHENQYDSDGVSVLQRLDPLSQEIQLAQGWNLISSYINPLPPDMINILNPILDKVVIIKNGKGQATIPIFGINDIGNWNVLEGYQIKISEPAVLPIKGDKVEPENVVIPISEGWQIIAYLRDNPSNAANEFFSIKNFLDIVKDNFGNIYYPAMDINSIGDLVPGQGYKLKANAFTNFTYSQNLIPPNPDKLIFETNSDEMGKSGKILSHFINFISMTGSDATLIIPEELVHNYLQYGDEIGIFNSEGILFGASVYEENNTAITLWGDDLSTQDIKEGLSKDENWILRIWDAKEDKEYPANIILNNEQESFQPDEIFMLQDFEMNQITSWDNPNYSERFYCFPNPVKDNIFLNLELDRPANFQIELFAFNREKLDMVKQGYFLAGNYQFNYPTKHLSDGLYFVRLLSNEKSEILKFVVQRN